MSQEAPAERGSVNERLRSLKNAAIFTAALLGLIVFGFTNSGLVLREPDICFLLSMGRWIVEHGQVPVADPFSYGYLLAAPAQPYVVYQWLTEVCFFLAYRLLGPQGLLLVSSTIAVTAFFIIPSRLLQRCGISAGRCIALAFWTLTILICHLSIRPELFTYLFTALSVSSLAGLYLKPRVRRIDWSFVASMLVIAILWSNLHCLFVILPLLLAFALAVSALSGPGEQDRRIISTLALALPATLAGTLLTPAGPALYSYTVHILTDPVNRTIYELRPVTLAALKDPALYPYLLFVLFSLAQLPAVLKAKGRGSWLFKLMLIGSMTVSFRSVRIIPLAATIMIASLAYLWKLARSMPADEAENSGAEPDSDALAELAAISSPRWALTCLAATAAGAYLMASVIPPEIPQGSAAFTPPLAAIAAIEKQPPPGRLLNDPHFGAVTMWKMKSPPKLFIDPRYYMYSFDYMQEYWTMVDARPGWQKILKKYRIDWLFLPARAPLIDAAERAGDFRVIYRDKTAAIAVNTGLRGAETGRTSKKKCRRPISVYGNM